VKATPAPRASAGKITQLSAIAAREPGLKSGAIRLSMKKAKGKITVSITATARAGKIPAR
jgi:hypothetical protein